MIMLAMKRFLKKNKVFTESKVDYLNLERVLPDHLSIKDIDKDVFDFALIYKHCVDSNEANDEKLLKRRKRKHVFVMAFLLFTTFRYLLCLWTQVKSGSLPDYYFDMIKLIGGLNIFLYLVVTIGILLTVRNYYIFGRANSQHMNWLNIILVLKGISPVNQLLIFDQKYCKTFIKTVHKVHLSINFTIYFIGKSVLLWCFFILITFDNLDYVIKYGIISSILLWSFIFFASHINYNAIKFFLIIVFYSLFLMQSLNDYAKSLINSNRMTKNKILNLLSIYNNALITISNLNQFWRKVFSTFIYSYLPICLLILNQILFETINPIMLLSLFSIFLSLMTFTLSLNLMAAHVFKQVLKINKTLFTLLKTHKLDSKSELKVILIQLKDI